MTDDTQPVKNKRRRLRAPTETVRERGKQDRLSAATGSSERGKAFVSGFLWPLRQLGKALTSLGRFRVLRWTGAILLPRYFRHSWRELRLVTWPNRRQSIRLTSAVIIFSIVFGVIIAGVDFGLDKLFKHVILKH